MRFIHKFHYEDFVNSLLGASCCILRDILDYEFGR